MLCVRCKDMSLFSRKSRLIVKIDAGSWTTNSTNPAWGVGCPAMVESCWLSLPTCQCHQVSKRASTCLRKVALSDGKEAQASFMYGTFQTQPHRSGPICVIQVDNCPIKTSYLSMAANSTFTRRQR